MPIVLTENEATESGITYDDRTGVSYQYPARYRRMIQPGERFVYYRGRRKRDGGRAPQVYFGSGVIGSTKADESHPGRFACEILDYRDFVAPVPFKNAAGAYLETGGQRRGYFQAGVRAISEGDFKDILEVARSTSSDERLPIEPPVDDPERAPAYASSGKMRAVEDFAVRVAIEELGRRFADSIVEPQPRNNPGFDVLVRLPGAPEHPFYVEIKGTTRGLPQFFITEGELQFARRNTDRFRLVVVYRIRLEAGTYELHWHEGPVTLESGFQLSPVQWACVVVQPGSRSAAATEDAKQYVREVHGRE